VELTKDFTLEQYEFALQSWTFVDFTGLTPQFTSLFGDIFLEAPDGSWWYLDMVDGTLLPEWATANDLVEELQTERGQDQYLLGGIAVAAANAGMILGETQVYDFIESPLMGGRIAVANLVMTDFILAVNLIGVLHVERLTRMDAGDPDEESDS
jgi:hypothetical protein